VPATTRLTTAQALIRFLIAQHSVRDGRRQPFFAGVFGIFGHGNVAGIGQALDQMSDRIRYYQCRNEQAMVHTAAAFAKHSYCAAWPTAGICAGDSGGPLTVRLRDGRTRLIGIVSLSLETAPCANGVGVFTRLAFVRTWLKKQQARD